MYTRAHARVWLEENELASIEVACRPNANSTRRRKNLTVSVISFVRRVEEIHESGHVRSTYDFDIPLQVQIFVCERSPPLFLLSARHISNVWDLSTHTLTSLDQPRIHFFPPGRIYEKEDTFSTLSLSLSLSLFLDRSDKARLVYPRKFQKPTRSTSKQRIIKSRNYFSRREKRVFKREKAASFWENIFVTFSRKYVSTYTSLFLNIAAVTLNNCDKQLRVGWKCSFFFFFFLTNNRPPRSHLATVRLQKLTRGACSFRTRGQESPAGLLASCFN